MTQYSICPKRSAVRAQAVYFLHSTMPSVTYLRLTDVSVFCLVAYFPLLIKSGFLLYIGRQAAPALRRVLLFLIRNIGHQTWAKIWVGTFSIRSGHPKGKTLN